MFVKLRTHVMLDQAGNAPVTEVYVNYKQITYMVQGTAQKYLLNPRNLQDVEYVPVTYIYFQGENFCLVQESPDEIRRAIDVVFR